MRWEMGHWPLLSGNCCPPPSPPVAEAAAGVSAITLLNRQTFALWVRMVIFGTDDNFDKYIKFHIMKQFSLS